MLGLWSSSKQRINPDPECLFYQVKVVTVQVDVLHVAYFHSVDITDSKL